MSEPTQGPEDPERPWLAERAVDAITAARVIGAQFHQLRGANVVPFAEGWDNLAFLVADEWVFRFPRRRIAVALLENEVRLLPELAPRLPLPIVVPTHVGHGGEDFPWPFAGYRMLPGRTACRAAPSEEQRIAAAPVLGEFLRALHDQDARALGAPQDTLERANMARRQPELVRRIRCLAKCGLLRDEGSLVRFVERTQFRSPSTRLTLNHGDLYARHLLLDERQRPCGVIDWGDIHAGDAAVDLAFAWGFLPPSGRREFFRTYGSVDAATLELARARALWSAVAILVYGLDVSDKALLREGRAALTHLGFGAAVA